MKHTLTEYEIWHAHSIASRSAIAWRAAGAVLLGLSTGLAAAWVWSLVEIYETFF
jgi:hypothetical protein